MQNFVQPGETITYNNSGSAIASGDVVVIGALVGVALGDIAATTGVGEVRLEGVVELAKVTPLAITQGDELFWDTSAKKVTKTATDKPIGTAHADAGSSATTVLLKLYGRGNGIPVAANVVALTDNSGGATADGTIGLVTAPSALTDNSGGSASTTLAAISQAEPANLAAQQAINIVIANAIASIAARQAEDRAAIIALTDAIKELSTKDNATLTSLKNAGLMASS